MKKTLILLLTMSFVLLSGCSDVADKIKNKNNPKPDVDEVVIEPGEYLFEEYLGDWIIHDIKIEGCTMEGSCFSQEDFDSYYFTYPSFFATAKKSQGENVNLEISYLGISQNIGLQSFNTSVIFDHLGNASFEFEKTPNYFTSKQGKINFSEGDMFIEFPIVYFEDTFIPSGKYHFKKVSNVANVKKGFEKILHSYERGVNVVFEKEENGDFFYHVYKNKFGHLTTIDWVQYNPENDTILSNKNKDTIDKGISSLNSTLKNEKLQVEFYKKEDDVFIFRIYDTIKKNNLIIHKETVNWAYYNTQSQEFTFEFGLYDVVEETTTANFNLMPDKLKLDVFENPITLERMELDYVFIEDGYTQIILNYLNNKEPIIYYEDDSGLYLVKTDDIINEMGENFNPELNLIPKSKTKDKILLLRYPLTIGKPTKDLEGTLRFIHQNGYNEKTPYKTFTNAIEIRHFNENNLITHFSFTKYEPSFGMISTGSGPASEENVTWLLVASQKK